MKSLILLVSFSLYIKAQRLVSGPIPDFCPSRECSGHLRIPQDGRALVYDNLNSIFDVLQLPGTDQMVQRLDAVNAYNDGQSREQKIAGAYIAYATAGKLMTMPAANFPSEEAASVAYGALKRAGMAEDAATIRSILSQNGGNALGLSDQQLIELWGGNEHWNLHAVLFSNPGVHNTVHITSLSDNNGRDANRNLGGFNDKGEWPQGGWFEDARGYNALLM